MKLSYPQWFALLVMKHFGPIEADRVLRYTTLQSLARRGLATCITEPYRLQFDITDEGLMEEELWGVEPRPKVVSGGRDG